MHFTRDDVALPLSWPSYYINMNISCAASVASFACAPHFSKAFMPEKRFLYSEGNEISSPILSNKQTKRMFSDVIFF